jgi:putative membrane protein
MAWIVIATGFVIGCRSAPQGGETKTASLSDAEIAAVVVTANAIDAELGELAASRAASAAVQAFGRTMARDHRAVNASAAALVAKLGVTPAENAVSRGLRADADAFRARLEQLSGAAFDRGYIEREVSYHQAVLEAVDQLLIPSAQNPELRQAITDVRPALMAHLQHAQHLRASLE